MDAAMSFSRDSRSIRSGSTPVSGVKVGSTFRAHAQPARGHSLGKFPATCAQPTVSMPKSGAVKHRRKGKFVEGDT